MSADERILLSVIVTTRNSARTLERCLVSIGHQTYSPLELIVIDNHSTDATLDIARRYADRVATSGPERSAQRNHGAKLAHGSTLLFVDSDMVLDANVTADALGELGRTGMPAVIVPEETRGEGFWSHGRILERSCYAGDDDVEAARLYTRSAFCEAGGFDLALTGGEDWDLSRRVALGRRLPSSRVTIVHDEGRTRLLEVYRKRTYYALGYLLYLRKHGRAALAQGNPILRRAHLRNWRRLVSHPLLTAGMLTLKTVETAAVAQVAMTQRWLRRRSPAAKIYG